MAPTGALEEGMCVPVSVVRVIMLRMTLNEFLMHPKESRRVLSKQASKQASMQAGRQVGRPAGGQASKQASRPELGMHSVGAMPWRGLLVTRLSILGSDCMTKSDCSLNACLMFSESS